MEKIKIMILENIPSMNKGEMLILDGMLESFKIFDDYKVSLLSDMPYIDIERYESRDVEVIDIRKSFCISKDTNNNPFLRYFYSIFVFIQHLLFVIFYKIFDKNVLKLFKANIWNEYLDNDLFIIGHNGSFSAGWAMLKTPLTFYYFYIIIFAKIIGKKIVIYGGSIPRFKRFKWFLNNITKITLNKIDLITLREESSYDNLKIIGFNGKAFVLPDLAFLSPPYTQNNVLNLNSELKNIKNDKFLIGMTITREIAFKSYSEDPSESYHIHILLISELIDQLTNNYDSFVILIPHCIGPIKEIDDRSVHNDIYSLLKNKDSVLVLTEEYDSLDLKKLISNLDLLIGERIHSVINALTVSTPSIAISWSQDQRLNIVKPLIKDYIFHSDSLESEIVLEKIDYIFKNQDEVSNQIKIQVENLNNKTELYGKLLKKLVKS